MSHFFRTYRDMRAPRVSLQGAVSVVIQLENKRQFTGKLHRLSITGGLLEVTPYIDERCKVLMALQLGAGLLQAKAEMMFPMRGGMGYFQPFRFTGFAAGARQTLELQIAELLRRTIGPNHAVQLNAPRLFMDSV
jgi:hypothetical protein